MKIFNKIALRRFYVLFAKEGLQIIRDPSNILIAFVLPLILLFLFGYAMSLDSTKVKIALVTEANYSPTTNSFIKSFMDSRFFDVVTITPDRRYAASLITIDKIRGIVVIPQHFEQILLYAQNEPALQIITDATETNMANFISGYVSGVWNNWLAENRYIPQPIVVVEPNFLYNQTLESKNFLVPGSITIILTLIGTMLTALVVAKEWERGTMEAIMATPIGVPDIIISKLIPYLMLGLGSVTFCLIVAFFAFHIPFRGSFYLLFLVSTTYLCAALGLGLVISALAKDQFVASQAAIVSAFMPSMMLSGFVYEINGMPKIIQFITHLVPAKYFIDCLRTIFLVGDAWRVILPRLAVIILIATLFLTIAVVKTKKRIT